MKQFLRSKKAMALAAVASLVVAAAAFAYWTSTGSGSGEGTVGSNNGTIALDGGTFSLPNLGASDELTVNAANDGDSSLRVSDVSIDSVSADTDHAGCNSTDEPDWFELDSDVAENTTIAANDNADLPNTLTVKLVDSATENQNVCQGATLTAHLSSTSL